MFNLTSHGAGRSIDRRGRGRGVGAAQRAVARGVRARRGGRAGGAALRVRRVAQGRRPRRRLRPAGHAAARRAPHAAGAEREARAPRRQAVRCCR